MKTLGQLLIRGFLAILSGILWILVLPKVRNWIWDRTVGRGQRKIIDARARVVDGKKDLHE